MATASSYLVGSPSWKDWCLSKVTAALRRREVTPHTSMPIVLAARPLSWLHRKKALPFSVPATVAERLIADNLSLTALSTSEPAAARANPLKSPGENPVQCTHSGQSKSFQPAGLKEAQFQQEGIVNPQRDHF